MNVVFIEHVRVASAHVPSLPFFRAFNLMLEISSPEARGQFSLHLILPMITGLGGCLHCLLQYKHFYYTAWMENPKPGIPAG